MFYVQSLKTWQRSSSAHRKGPLFMCDGRERERERKKNCAATPHSQFSRCAASWRPMLCSNNRAEHVLSSGCWVSEQNTWNTATTSNFTQWMLQYLRLLMICHVIPVAFSAISVGWPEFFFWKSLWPFFPLSPFPSCALLMDMHGYALHVRSIQLS